jgi:tRNA 2-thiouridine synthesizing protein D
MLYTILVTGPAYGSQQASSALLFSYALIESGHNLHGIFFYREGVLNANRRVSVSSDEVCMVKAWRTLHQDKKVPLRVCISSALRRGVTGSHGDEELGNGLHNLHPDFELTGLGIFSESILICDRLVQF